MKYIATSLMTLIFLAGCSPVSVKKVESADPVEGARYCVKRPTLSLSLQTELKDSAFFKLEDCASAHCIHAITGEPLTVNKDLLQATHSHIAESGIEMTYCLAAETDVQRNYYNLDFSLSLTQNLDSVSLYEIEHKYNFLGLANSELEVITDEEGCLSSVTSTETDQTLEIVSAIADFSISRTIKLVELDKAFLDAGGAEEISQMMLKTMAKTDGGVKMLDALTNYREREENEDKKIVLDEYIELLNTGEAYDKEILSALTSDFGMTQGLGCPFLKDRTQLNPSFQAYLDRHATSLIRLNQVLDAIEQSYGALASESAAERKLNIENVGLLKTEKVALEEAIDAAGFPVPEDRYDLTLNGAELTGVELNTEDGHIPLKWFSVELCETGLENNDPACHYPSKQ